MPRSETLALRWQDLVQMSRDHKHTYLVRNFDGNVGRVTQRGVIMVIKGIDASKKPFKVNQLFTFKEAFFNVKAISRKDKEDTTQKVRLIADRRYQNQRLMTVPYSPYRRPKRKEGEG